MSEEQGLTSFEQAAREALAELDQAESDETLAPASPATEEDDETFESQAAPEASEQPAADSEETDGEDVVEEIFDDADTADGSDSIELDMNAELVLPGVDGPTTLQALVEGNMRHADYTQKTQSVADERRAVEAMKEEAQQAVAFWEALRKDPQGVVKHLAIEAKLIDKDASFKGKLDNSPITSAEEMEAEIERRVNERLQEHPTVTAAAEVRATQWIDSAFSQIEETHGVSLGPKSRTAVLREAARLGVDDLEFVFNGMNAKRRERKTDADKLRKASPARPTGASSRQEDTTEIDDVRDAFEASLVELGLSG